MSGRMLLHDGAVPPPGPHDHIDLVTDAGCTVRFCDPRRFGLMDLASENALGEHPLLRHMGPEPLSPDFTRSEEHTSELQSLMRISYAVFCLKKKTQPQNRVARNA